MCCGEGGLSPQYFFSQMTIPEAEAYVRGMSRRCRAGWEQARLIAFCTMRIWCQELNADNFINFPWEHEQAPVTTQKDVDRLRAMIPQFESLLSSKRNGSSTDNNEATAG